MKRVLALIICIGIVSSLMPLPLVYGQEEMSTPSAEQIVESTPSAEIIPEILPTPIATPSAAPMLLPTPTSSLPSATIRQPAHLRAMGKKHYLAREQVILHVDNAVPDDIAVTVVGPKGNVTIPMQRLLVENGTDLTLNPPADFAPGKYTVTVTDPLGTRVSQDFSWGVLAINTNKSIYSPHENASIAIAVLDDGGRMVCDAEVTLLIVDPSSQTTTLSTDDGTIKVNKGCTLHDVSIEPDYETAYVTGDMGTYGLTLSATTKNGISTITDAFEVATDVPFDVARIAPTRIYPPNTYPVRIPITARQDFTGQIVESVPENFDITPLSGVLPYTDTTIATSSSVLMRPPFDGEFPVTQGFGEEKDDYTKFGLVGHDGIDFALSEGTNVLAVDLGVVALAGTGAYGTTVVVDHSWGRSYYGHLEEAQVAKGQRVRMGERLGLSGHTGEASGPHLHFGIKLRAPDMGNGYFGKIDPQSFLTRGVAQSDVARKKIVWDVNIKAGETMTLGYQFKSPPTSPELYLVGPLRFELPESLVFQESRQWQIAADTGTTYYVSVADGNDTNCTGLATTAYTSGSGQPCPWKTIAKVNASSFSAGDTISFKVGETWREQLNIPSSGSAGNQITFNSYGTGNKPKIYGSTVPSSWTQEDYVSPPTLTKVQGGTTTSASASVTKSFASTPTNGNLMVAIGWGTNADSNASITGWTKAVAVLTTSAGYMAIFYKVAGAGESKDVVLSWTSSTATEIAIEEWSGLVSPVLDKTASTANTGSGVTSRSSGTTATTTGTYEILIAGFGHGNTTSARSYTNSFTEDYDVTSSNTWEVASRTVSATGAYETTQSWTTSRLTGGAIATFKGTETPKVLYYATQSTDPGYIWFIDTGGTIHNGNKVATKDLLLTDYDWWFDSTNSRLYINSATDPLTRYNSVEVTDTTRDRGIYWTGSGISYITVDGFDIAFVTGVGIVARGDYWTITNNHVHHIGNETGGHSYGIELQTATESRVANNIVHDTYRAGIFIVTSYTPYINQNNTIESNTVYDCLDALILANTEATNVTFAGTIIRYNNLYHSAGYSLGSGSGFGIDLVGLSGDVADTYQMYYNIISVQKAAIEIGGYATNTAIYNNTVKSSSGKGISIEGSGNSGVLLKNNIVVDAGLYGLYVPDKTQVSAADYNLWYAPTGTGYANINATNYTSGDFAAYKTATGWDTNGLWQDPVVVSASTPDFHLQSSSPAINAGVNVSLTTDYAGASVPQGSAPDMGAYEYASGPTLDQLMRHGNWFTSAGVEQSFTF